MRPVGAAPLLRQVWGMGESARWCTARSMRTARASQATARYRAHHYLGVPFLAAPKAEAPVAKPAPSAKTQPATEVPAAVVPRKPAAAVVEAAPVPATEPKAEPKAAAATAVAKTPAAPVVEEAIAPSAEGPARRAASPVTRSRVAVAPAPEEEGPEASWVLDSAPEAEPTGGAHLWAGVALLRQTACGPCWKGASPPPPASHSITLPTYSGLQACQGGCRSRPVA